MTGLDESNLSVSNTHHRYQSHNPTFRSTPAMPTSDALITSTPHTKQNFCFDKQVVLSQTNTTYTRNSDIEENVKNANKFLTDPR